MANQIKFFHTGKEGIKGGTTIAYQWLDYKTGKMLVAFSRCSDSETSKDLFSKKHGRLRAAGRLEKGNKVQMVSKPETMGKYEFLLTLVAKNDDTVKEQYGTKFHAR